jgi:hypothetical protein
MLAWHAVQMVDLYGGVLEHPAGSTLWRNQGLPIPLHGEPLSYTFGIDQVWFGFRARKPSWLWIRGVPNDQLPEVPFRFGRGSHVICTSKKIPDQKVLKGDARQETVSELADWLVAVARLVPPGFRGEGYAHRPLWPSLANL